MFVVRVVVSHSFTSFCGKCVTDNVDRHLFLNNASPSPSPSPKASTKPKNKSDSGINALTIDLPMAGKTERRYDARP